MSQNARILAALADRDDWVTTRDLYDLAGGYIGALHSRISELRAQGHLIESRKVPGKTGAAGHEYRLIDGGLDAPQAALVGADGDLRSVEPAPTADPTPRPVAGGLGIQLSFDTVAA